MGVTRFRWTGLVIALLALAAFTQLNPDADLIGVIQRMLAALIYAWLILFGGFLSGLFRLR